MKHLNVLFIFAALLLAAGTVSAAKIHECEDELGNKTFQKHCPPGSKSLAEKNYSAKVNTSDESSQLPNLILYTVPQCEVCDQMRKHLSGKNIPVTEKNIKDNGELQQELKAKTGGDLRVPVLLIGEKVVAGYDVSSLSAALVAAGYETEQSDTK